MKSEEKPKPDFVVVDVRDDDFIGGNIKGAVNIPSKDFLMDVDALVRQTKEVPLVIFHCALSQVRWVFQAIILKPKTNDIHQKWTESCYGKRNAWL